MARCHKAAAAVRSQPRINRPDSKDAVRSSAGFAQANSARNHPGQDGEHSHGDLPLSKQYETEIVAAWATRLKTRIGPAYAAESSR